MSAYEALAFSYDALTQDIPYEQMLSYMEALLQRHGRQPETVLDLACGTGSMSVLMAQKGYRVLGADLSEDMLAMAFEKAAELEENRPYFICQPMEGLELPYAVDLIVCCLDSLNYVTDPNVCRKALRRCYEALAPGGVLIFDINSAEKLKSLDGQVFLDEDEDTYCVWRAEFDRAENICYYGMDIFQREDEVWLRSFEEHLEYAYTVEELTDYLRRAGFETVEIYGDRSFDAPKAGEQRIYFYAQKE
ncbi:MAG: methyltransferase domain-containing protein [Oscillospiraceae bacterium]|nr:methyltransferase domain-containing protein [Oscillospiraceae bacterium]